MSNKNIKIVPLIIICLLIISIIATSVVLFSFMNKSKKLSATQHNLKKVTQKVDNSTIENVNYKIEKDDVSFYNKDRNLTLTQYFEKIIITDKGKNFDNINSEIQKESDKFIVQAKENEAFIADEGYASDMHYTNTHSAKVFLNNDGILSIKMVTQWYMGGVHNSDEYGLNFDLNTGKKLSIENILNMSRGDAEKYIKDESKKQIQEGFFDDAPKTIDSYNLNDFAFYLDDDYIYLCYPTYSLAPGAAGCITMKILIPQK